jgi:hypothetical protein
MSRSAQNLLLVVVLAATGLGFAYLYRLRIETGDVFPPYSSLRADPLGTRALYESLADLPELRVDRRFQPLEDLTGAPPRTILLAGMGAGDWSEVTSKEFAAIDGAVRNGSRLVLALRANFADPKEGELRNAGDDDEDEDRPNRTAKAKPEKTEADPHRAAAAPRGTRRDLEVGAAGKPEATADLKRLWGIDLLKLGRMNYDKGAGLDPAAPSDLPPKLRWKSDSYFVVEPGAPWRVIYRALGKPVILESRYGRGSIVVMGDAYLLSNEGLLNDRSPPLLSWIIGPNRRVEFDESHLGVIEDVGVAALARRYGLTYAAGTLLLLAMLFVWRQTALFVPPPGEVAEATLDCSHTAALEALLLRSVSPAELIRSCASEWRATAPPSALPRLEAALGADARRPAPEAYNGVVRALRRR